MHDTRPIYFTYILFDYCAIPRYAGKGGGDPKRDEHHEQYSDPVNWRKNEFIEQTWIVLGEIPKIRIAENLTEDEAYSLEILLISSIGRADQGKGPLTNMTDGGDGVSGKRSSAFSRLIRSIHASRTAEQRSEIAKRGITTLGIEGLSQRGRKRAQRVPKEQKSEQMRQMQANLTSEEKSKRGKYARSQVKMTSEQLGEVHRQAMALRTPEQRAETIEKLVKIAKARDPAQFSAEVKRGVFEKTTSDQRHSRAVIAGKAAGFKAANQKLTTEQRRANSLKGIANKLARDTQQP